jgi:hypothetical protein
VNARRNVFAKSKLNALVKKKRDERTSKELPKKKDSRKKSVWLTNSDWPTNGAAKKNASGSKS